MTSQIAASGRLEKRPLATIVSFLALARRGRAQLVVMAQVFPGAQALAFGLLWIVVESIATRELLKVIESQLADADLGIVGATQVLNEPGVGCLLLGFLGRVADQELLHLGSEVSPKLFVKLLLEILERLGPLCQIRPQDPDRGPALNRRVRGASLIQERHDERDVADRPEAGDGVSADILVVVVGGFDQITDDLSARSKQLQELLANLFVERGETRLRHP